MSFLTPGEQRDLQDVRARIDPALDLTPHRVRWGPKPGQDMPYTIWTAMGDARQALRQHREELMGGWS